MKKISTLFLGFAMAFCAHSQVVLTYETHSPIPGDSPRYFQVDFMSFGQGGPNQVWDLSGYNLPEELSQSVFGNIVRSGSPGIMALGPNMVLVENDKTNYLVVNQNKYGIAGFTSELYSVHYYQTLDRLVFPFAYGNTHTKPFTGRANYTNGNFVDFEGISTTEVDGQGFVVLPGHKVVPVIRVKQVVTSVQATVCGNVDYTSTRYLLYAANERYPLVSTIRHQHDFSNGCNQVKEETYLNAKIFSLEPANEPTNTLEIAEEANFSYSIFPNPFSTELKINYTITEKGKVNISLFDIQGKRIASILDNSNQNEGFYSQRLNPGDYNLKPGIYFVRFEFGSKAQSERVIYIR